jgi:hypothetical protein
MLRRLATGADRRAPTVTGDTQDRIGPGPARAFLGVIHQSIR